MALSPMSEPAPLRILMLTPQLPYPPQQGTSLRNYHLLRYLAGRHAVSLLSFSGPETEPAHLAHLESLCHRVRTVDSPRRPPARRLWTLFASPWPDMAWRLASPAYARELTALLSAQPWDVLLVEGIELARYLWQVNPLPAGSRPRLVFDDHNAEYLLQKRACLADARQPRRWVAAAYSLVQWLKLRRFERQVCRKAQGVVAVSAADAGALAALDRASALRPAVVPNGVDLAANRPDLPPLPGMAHPSLVFTGKMDFRPNVDAVLWFSRQVLPLLWAKVPEAHFYIVGQSPSPRLEPLRAERRVTITGRVPEAQPYIAGADVYVVPLRVGGGTRLKVLEAMAIGRSLVSTSLGVEGLGVRDGEHLLLADEPKAFAERILTLLASPARQRALGQAARAFVEEHYGWESIGPRLESVLRPES